MLRSRALWLTAALALGCSNRPAARYADAIEQDADSVVIMRDSSSLDLQEFEAHLAEKARDFEAVSPPPEFVNVHAQLVAPIQELGATHRYTRQQLAAALTEYLDARQRVRRMLARDGIELGPAPPTRDLLTYWLRP